ncbi:DEAD/DEAH box helicase [Sporosarcina koreensis]|uniref:DEAD/DEAH box helicase n=1 Tax=Sporosarcina koreensis TaxID=334735 RepID=UPI00058D5EF4|nr:AAA domain-containing protein [Sporosarcina koreensis]
MNRNTYEDTVTCELAMTASARKGIGKVARDEHAFFAVQKSFTVHIEKRPDNQHGSQSFSFFFDNTENAKLSQLLEGRVAVLDCVVKNDGFLAVGFHVRGKRDPAATNRRLRASVRFRTGKSTGRTLPVEFAALVRELPVAEERSEYVKKRIGGWEGYLRIMEKNADVEDIHVPVQSVSVSADVKKVSVGISGMQAKHWKRIQGFSAKFDGAAYDLGNVISADRKRNRVEIELKPSAVAQARKTGFQGQESSSIIFSNFAELSQVRRLRKGFKDLQDGLAANGNLEKILFEERPVVRINNRKEPLEYSTQLNEFQEEAVSGAMNASDIYVIQGPPGTGKTTVISEICSQAVKAGMRTLVASQANLAVDNALGRLLDHPEIRILRYGRTESIEEEGRKFIEENVAEHWRQQTLETIEGALASHSSLAERLEQEIDAAGARLAELDAEEAELKHRMQVRREQKEELASLEQGVKEIERTLRNFSLESEKNHSRETSLQKKIDSIQQDCDSCKAALAGLASAGRPLAELNAEQSRLADRLRLLKEARSIGELEEKLSVSENDYEQLFQRHEAVAAVLGKIPSAAKLNDLNDLLDSIMYSPSNQVDQQMTALIRQIDSLQEAGGSDGATAWSETLARVDKAIRTVTDILRTHHFQNRITVPTGFRNRHSIDSIQETVSRVGRYLIQPSVKKILATTSFSVEAYDCLENLTKAAALLHDRRNFILAYLSEAKSAASLFRDIREGAAAEVAAEAETLSVRLTEHSRRIDELKQQLASIRQEAGPAQERALPEVLAETEAAYKSVTEAIRKAAGQEAEREAVLSEHTALSSQLSGLQEELESCQQRKRSLQDELGRTEKTAADSRQKIESLRSGLISDPSPRLLQVKSEREETARCAESAKGRLANVPVIQSLQAEWQKMLKEASPYDLDEIRKLYVKHANVIGTTCVASARKGFAEDYPEFDLVIIDEVSKATPPELLLPMLKGKKIILVGDHHQLPPLVGQETMEEFLEEMPEDAQKKEMEMLLKESLFERLFRTLPKQNKTMLGKQYRMHEKIMRTITPFYNGNGYTLACGLADSDAARAHNLETPLIQRDSHVIWLDQPNTPACYEAKPKGGTSRYNESELETIRNLLLELEEGTELAIRNGTLPAGTKKRIGVISFYGEQVKRIDHLIQEEYSFGNLEFRTGSVDKFQGMEMDIIIVSFVRNHGDAGGDIGFAKDYRRLNVALSRAKELLVIVGSSEMFAGKPKSPQVRKMYSQLYETVKNLDGIRPIAEPAVN